MGVKYKSFLDLFSMLLKMELDHKCHGFVLMLVYKYLHFGCQLLMEYQAEAIGIVGSDDLDLKWKVKLDSILHTVS